MAKTRKKEGGPTIIKKYANRRLYDTGRSSYITLDDISEMVRDGYEFVVQDAKTGKDITRSVLTQIIVDQESKDENLLPTNFMKNLIGFYGDNIQSLIPDYLENTFDLFVKNQEQMRQQINQSLENINPMSGIFPQTPNNFEELNRKNMEMFEKTMKMFSPFNADGQKDKDKKDV